jgi:thiol-disulfide isomerase/thioredoxin
MRIAKKFIIFLGVFLFLSSFFVFPAQAAQKKVDIDFFYSKYCPHCHKEKPFLEKLVREYPQIQLKEYEITSSQENRELFAKTAKKYNVDSGAVPITFIGDNYVIGYESEQTTGKEIENYVIDALGGQKVVDENKTKNTLKSIRVPFLGSIDISKFSLPALTITLGTLDGFNPCSMWALFFLITLLLTSGSRKKLLLIGGVFILVSSISYFLFMTAWLNLFLVIGFYNFIRYLIALAAIVIGIWRIRDFIYFKPGTCKVTGTEGKLHDKIARKMQDVLKPSTLIATIFGVALLALSVNLVEFFCSAGFPAVYTKILAQSQLSTMGHLFYIFIYVFFYMLDDLIVWLIALFTFNKIALSDKYAKWAALIGGVLMVILGVILVLKPAWLMFA